MGLFDRLRCEHTLPWPDGECPVADWQTQSLGCTLDEFVLSASGRLLHANGRDTGFHGLLHFHGIGSDGALHRFEAKFTDGQLQHLLPAAQAQYAENGLRLTSRAGNAAQPPTPPPAPHP
jgi:hypothetical protein